MKVFLKVVIAWENPILSSIFFLKKYFYRVKFFYRSILYNYISYLFLEFNLSSYALLHWVCPTLSTLWDLWRGEIQSYLICRSMGKVYILNILFFIFQVRGLAHTEGGSVKDGFCSSPSLSMYPGRPFSTPMDKDPLPLSPYSPGFESPLKIGVLPHMPHITFTENPPHPDGRPRGENEKDRGSPIPRRKQVC